jgi:hypothetical protein
MSTLVAQNTHVQDLQRSVEEYNLKVNAHEVVPIP